MGLYKIHDEAMENIVSGEGGRVTGTASNGLQFVGFPDANGNITNFYPIIS